MKADPWNLLRRWYDGHVPGPLGLRHDTYLALREHDEAQRRHIPTARINDPDSSHTTVTNINNNTPLQTQILAVIDEHPTRWFDDGDLTDWIRARYGRAPDRNIVARARSLLPAGLIESVGRIERTDRRVATIHHRKRTNP